MKSTSDVVRAFFLAHAEGRLDDMLALVHAEVVWEPTTPTARGFYLGREGTIGMLTDMRTALGDFRLELHDFVELQDGQVQASGVAVIHDERRDFTTLITVREGLIARLVPFDLD